MCGLELCYVFQVNAFAKLTRPDSNSFFVSTEMRNSANFTSTTTLHAGSSYHSVGGLVMPGFDLKDLFNHMSAAAQNLDPMSLDMQNVANIFNAYAKVRKSRTLLGYLMSSAVCGVFPPRELYSCSGKNRSCYSRLFKYQLDCLFHDND